MPLLTLARSSRKGRLRTTKGLRDHMRSNRNQANPSTLPGAVPCYKVDPPQEFDAEGEELSPDAQVWKTYVKEADQVDGELVDGWNKSMDVMLIFAALFLAITTAFVIESYKSLKQDPAEVSSQTLLTISQTLITISQTLALIANGTQPTSPPPIVEDISFQTSTKAISVNILWFLSLSFNITVSLIAMLVKEWCSEFMSGRTGPPGSQVRRRQQRWDGLLGWRMKEVIGILPSLIHLALILFAIGLCVFLWDVHSGVAVSLAVVTFLVTSAYLACTVLPLLYDFCPYGTVLSRAIKQFMKGYSQPTRNDGEQDEVTARALHWMITDCETPQSVNVAIQSLAGADENLPPDLFDRCNVWSLIKQRLESRDLRAQSSQNGPVYSVYKRAWNSHLKMKRRADQLKYGENDETRRLEQLVLGVQSCFNSVVHNIPTNYGSLDQGTIDLLKRCTLLGRYYLAEGKIVGALGLYEYAIPVESEGLAEDLVTLLEQHFRGEMDFDSGPYYALSAGLALALCCNTSRGLTELSVKVSYFLRLVRGYSSRSRGCGTHLYSPLHLALGTLWILISADYSGSSKLPESSRYTSTEAALDTLWAIIMGTMHSDWSSMRRLDTTYLSHGMLYLLANPGLCALNATDCGAIGSILFDLNYGYNLPFKIQGSYHAQYIQDLTESLITVTDVRLLVPQVIQFLDSLVLFSPWEESYLFPTPEIYVFMVQACCWHNDDVEASKKYVQPSLFPFPQYSPRLIQLFSEKNIVSGQLVNWEANRDPDKRAFALAQLWLLFNMSLRASDRTSQELTALEGMLLEYRGLDGNLDNQEEVAGQLEIELTELLDQHDEALDRSLRVYLYRVVEVMLQQRNTPLGEMVYRRLVNVPVCLRGMTSFVNLETDWSSVYTDL